MAYHGCFGSICTIASAGLRKVHGAMIRLTIVSYCPDVDMQRIRWTVTRYNCQRRQVGRWWETGPSCRRLHRPLARPRAGPKSTRNKTLVDLLDTPTCLLVYLMFRPGLAL